MTHQKGSLGGMLQTLCTNLEDRIVCNLLTNQIYVHSQGKWYSSAMDNIFFEVKKSVSKMHFPGIWRSKFTDLVNKTVKKINLWGKTAVDKSAWIKACTVHYNNICQIILLTY